MVAFRLRYRRWHEDSAPPLRKGPIFRVSTEAIGPLHMTQPPFTISVLMEEDDFNDLQNEIALQEGTRFPDLHRLQTAVVRFAVTRIVHGLKDGRFLEPPTGNILTIPVEAADLPAIRQLFQEKTCTYQIRQGRDLLCAVASPNDPTRRGVIGLQTVAPTSRDLCQTCALPDTDYVCSHLMHPEIQAMVQRGIIEYRELLSALCDLGKPEISRPSKCRAGGHDCWEWLVESELSRPFVPVSPLTLPEAFDYLDVCWRLAFGKRQSLVQPKSLTGVAMLSLPCATREELSARLSALVDVLNSLHIPNERLPDPSKVRPGTLNRLQACLKGCLYAAEYPACEHAITVLRAVIDLRDCFQHGATARELPTLCSQLALPFPLPAWGETWECLRGIVTGALGVIREAIRRYADAETGTPS